ncbi:MAG: hypothetical protein ACKVN9_06205 [Methylophilaceae bacterium]
MAIIISEKILKKITDEKHSVSRREVEQCFENIDGSFLTDTREDHVTNPVTLWFVAPTNKNRLLKIMFVFDNGDFYLKSAYDATDEIVRIYNKFKA